MCEPVPVLQKKMQGNIIVHTQDFFNEHDSDEEEDVKAEYY